MAKKQTKPVVPDDIELVPDAWPKFEKLIKSAAKGGPKPHKAKPKQAE